MPANLEAAADTIFDACAVLCETLRRCTAMNNAAKFASDPSELVMMAEAFAQALDNDIDDVPVMDRAT